ncbi:MAG: hypothetical protein ABI651_08680, partial [Verrucomicrobiota bacterium]
QRNYPHVACGLKRGFTFYHHDFGQPFGDDTDRGNQLMVGASPHDEIADTHWYRPDFDHFLVREAQSIGVEYFDQCRLNAFTGIDDSFVVEGERLGKDFSACARFVIDASGPRGFLHRALSLAEISFPKLPPTQGLYSHFTNVRRFGDVNPELVRPADSDSTLSTDSPPYPVDDAAMHHVFDGGWIWVLRFNNGLTSAGVAATGRLADELNLAEGMPGWKRLLSRLPSVQQQFAEATAELPFVHTPCLSFRSRDITGRGWALLPSSAGFVDPLLSTGFPLTLLGVARLAEAIEKDWGTDRFEEDVNAYARQTVLELAAAEELVAALYATMKDFSIFVPLSLLYFAAASFSEAARRMGRDGLARSFLLLDHPLFASEFHACCAQALRGFPSDSFTAAQKDSLVHRIRCTIEPFDLAGLNDQKRRNWYPADARDILAAAPRLGASELEVKELLWRSGFFNP